MLKIGSDGINVSGEPVIAMSDRINDRIKLLVEENLGVSARRIVEMMDKCESTIRSTMALLKKQRVELSNIVEAIRAEVTTPLEKARWGETMRSIKVKRIANFEVALRDFWIA